MATEYKTNNRWQYWSGREFFKDVTGKGKNFEQAYCLPKFRQRGIRNVDGSLTGASPEYERLRKKVQEEFEVDIYDYDMFSQVQLGFNPVILPNGKTVDFFVADQVFVKFNNLGKAEDVIVIENKLKYTTDLTDKGHTQIQVVKQQL